MPHPIEALMKTAMESIQQMVEVNTIVGDPVETSDGSVIIPVSKVACGFAAGGSEFPSPEEKNSGGYQGDEENSNSKGNRLPFGGGSGAGVSVQPVGFLVVGKDNVRLLPVDSNANAILDRVIDTVPGLIDKLSAACHKKRERRDEIISEYD